MDIIFEGGRYEITNTTRTTGVKGDIKHSRAHKTYLHIKAPTLTV